MNKQQRDTLDNGEWSVILDPSLAALPSHPTPDEFDAWQRACKVATVIGRWTDRAGMYGYQFRCMILDREGDVHYWYSSAGCGYDKAALCFMRGISIPHPTRGPIPRPSPCPSFDRWIRDLGFVMLGNCGVR